MSEADDLKLTEIEALVETIEGKVAETLRLKRWLTTTIIALATTIIAVVGLGVTILAHAKPYAFLPERVLRLEDRWDQHTSTTQNAYERIAKLEASNQAVVDELAKLRAAIDRLYEMRQGR